MIVLVVIVRKFVTVTVTVINFRYGNRAIVIIELSQKQLSHDHA